MAEIQKEISKLAHPNIVAEGRWGGGRESPGFVPSLFSLALGGWNKTTP